MLRRSSKCTVMEVIYLAFPPSIKTGFPQYVTLVAVAAPFRLIPSAEQPVDDQQGNERYSGSADANLGRSHRPRLQGNEQQGHHGSIADQRQLHGAAAAGEGDPPE